MSQITDKVIDALQRPQGGGSVKGRRKPSCVRQLDNLKQDKTVVCPPPNDHDQMCLARCLVYGMLFHQEGGARQNVSNALKRLRNNASDLWTYRAAELCIRCGVNRNTSAGQPELVKFATHLRTLGFVIRVFSTNMQNALFFREDSTVDLQTVKILYLVLSEGHYMFIPRMNIYSGRQYFCDLCVKPFNHLQQHRCALFCHACKSKTCTDTESGD